jgi:hypothetical protein
MTYFEGDESTSTEVSVPIVIEKPFWIKLAVFTVAAMIILKALK